MKFAIAIACAALCLCAQEEPKPAPKPEVTALSNEAALELQLVDSEQKAAIAPMQAIVDDLQAAAAKAKKLADQAVAPLAERRNELVLKVCKAAGINEEDVKAQKCVVDLKAKTVSRAPDPPAASAK